MFLLYWTLQLATVFAGFMCFYYTGRDTLLQKIGALGLARNREKSNGIIRVSAIALSPQNRRKPCPAWVTDCVFWSRPVSVYKRSYLWFYWTQPILDAVAQPLASFWKGGEGRAGEGRSRLPGVGGGRGAWTQAEKGTE